MMHYQELLQSHPTLSLLQKLAHKHKLQTYLVGGFVRDLLLGKKPKDIDILCLGNGIQLAQSFASTTRGSISVFKNFGTAMVRYKNQEIEFVQARKESYTPSSRKPTVSQGTLMDDLARRDFTINAIALSLNSDTLGQFVDPFNGIQDLKKKIIKTPLDPMQTFSDDPLRMLRGIRFTCQLHFTPIPQLLQAIRQQAHRLAIVSKERISTEFNKILLAQQPSRGIYLLDQTALLALILPELIRLKGTERIGKHTHKDNFKHTLQVLDNLSRVSTNLWLRWAALLHDIAKPNTKHFNPALGFTFHGHEELGARMVPNIFRKMRLPLNQKMHYVKKLVRLHLRPIALTNQVTHAAVRRLIYDAGDQLEDLMLLSKADITSKNKQKATKYLDNLRNVEKKIEMVRKNDQIINLQPVINGNIIMNTYGLKPGKKIGVIKKALKHAVLQGIIPNEYAPLYDYMLTIGKQHGLVPLT